MGAGRHEELTRTLRGLARRVAEDCGVELVELQLRGSSRRRTLRLDIDRPGARGVDLDDCARVSEAMGAELESDEIIDTSYVLEVSSPGADRPIRTEDDIRRNTGRRIVVVTREPVDGRRSFRGLLVDGRNGGLTLRQQDGSEMRIPREKVETARQDVGFHAAPKRGGDERSPEIDML